MNSLNIAIVMITMDRSPKDNYLATTLENFKRAGVWKSHYLHSFHIFDSGSPDGWLQSTLDSVGVSVTSQQHHNMSTRILACQNAGSALVAGGLTRADYVLFVEDDLDVCDRFLDSVAVWLYYHANANHGKYRLFAFGAAYDQVRQNFACGVTAWEYPVGAFYGTQCFAIRPQDAVSLGSYIESNPLINNSCNNPNAYDLMFHAWADLKYPACSFLASVPSFVQHIGRQSICTGKEETHTFPWQGRGYTYNRRDVVIAQ